MRAKFADSRGTRGTGRNSLTGWRRGWDSNPRDPFGPNGFQDRRSQPLSYPSDPIDFNTGFGSQARMFLFHVSPSIASRTRPSEPSRRGHSHASQGLLSGARDAQAAGWQKVLRIPLFFMYPSASQLYLTGRSDSLDLRGLGMRTGSRTKLLNLSFRPAHFCILPLSCDGRHNAGRFAAPDLRRPVRDYRPFDFSNTPKSCFKPKNE